MKKYGKTAVFPDGYGRNGEIPHGRLWPNWGLYRVKGGSQMLHIKFLIVINTNQKLYVYINSKQMPVIVAQPYLLRIVPKRPQFCQAKMCSI